MDDLTQYLYEFLMERCMKDLREDAEYNACISAVLQQEEQVRAGLNPEQQSQLDRFIDQILEQKELDRLLDRIAEQDSVEKEHVFRGRWLLSAS